MTALRTDHPGTEMETLCGLFGKSRQAYYQRSKYIYNKGLKEEILLQMVKKERKKMPRIGGRKLLHLIQPKLPLELYLGRDLFFDFLRSNGLLVKKRHNRTRTTNSNHWLRRYPNLIVGFIPDHAHQLLVSDITYIETEEGFVYLSLITDGYSRKVVGWELGATLEAKHSIKALRMAIRQLPCGIEGTFHHSDRGVQYCSGDYVKLLLKNHFRISMTESGDPLENAIAERVNGILKDEWLNGMTFKTIEEARVQIGKVIKVYNQSRPHSSLDMQTPDSVHTQSGTLKKHWKNYYKMKSNDSFVEPNKVMVTL